MMTRKLTISIALALLMLLGVNSLATATTNPVSDSIVVSGSCGDRGDRDDNC